MESGNKRTSDPSVFQCDDSMAVIIGFKWYVNTFENLLYQAYAASSSMPGHIPGKVWEILSNCELEIAGLLILGRKSVKKVTNKQSSESEVTIKRIEGHISLIRGLLDFLYARHPDGKDLPKKVWDVLSDCEKALKKKSKKRDDCSDVICMDSWVCDGGNCCPPGHVPSGGRSASKPMC